MNQSINSKNAMAVSYLTLRKAIGLLGSLLPVVLYMGGLIFFKTGIQSSVSYYYYTGMGDVYVGCIFVIGFFLFSYKGYKPADDLAGDLGCLFAVGMVYNRLYRRIYFCV